MYICIRQLEVITTTLKKKAMKSNISTLVNSYIQDSRSSIEGNVADHLILTAQSEEFGYYFYLTDYEIEVYENGTDRERAKTREDIRRWIRINYDFDILELFKN